MPGLSGMITTHTRGAPPVIDSRVYTALSSPFAKHFYVNSGDGTTAEFAIGGSDGNDGLSWRTPLASIDAATGKCVASRGDVVHVAPGHVETVTAAAGLDLDIIGVTYIGYGSGDLRPQINFTTAVGADMDVDAAQITMYNFRFTGGVDALTGPIDINAADFALLNCVTQDVTGQATDFIVTDANADGLLIDGWIHKGAAAAGAETAISIVGGDYVSIQNFDIDGNFGTACIENVTTAGVNLNVGASSISNLARTRNADDVLVTCVATTTGWINNIFGRLADNAANITEAFVMADGQFGNELYLVNLDGERAIQFNATASADS
jgi:hypothetical protein